MEIELPPDTLFSCVGPKGRLIAAWKQRWEEHVRARHPEVAPHIEAIVATLEAPEFIVSDVDNPAGQNYYRFGVLPPPYDRLYLKVVADFHLIDSAIIGIVIAAYPTGRIARGEVQQWP